MITQIFCSLITIFIAIIIHEIAHGYIAWKLGDDTAKQAGRLSFNPMQHIDMFGTIILPIILLCSKSGFIFGWAKPIPVNYSKLQNKKRNIILVASAGIIANFILAVISAIMLKISVILPANPFNGIMAMFWLNMIFFNIFLALFNLLPIPPLDGSKILLSWSNNKWIKKYLNSDRGGLIAIILLLFIIPAFLQSFGINFNPLASTMKQLTLLLSSLLI